LTISNSPLVVRLYLNELFFVGFYGSGFNFKSYLKHRFFLAIINVFGTFYFYSFSYQQIQDFLGRPEFPSQNYFKATISFSRNRPFTLVGSTNP